MAIDKAGVPDNVIDLMVALSYPKKFVVERAAAASIDDSGYVGSPIGWWDPFLSPVIPFSMLGRDCFCRPTHMVRPTAAGASTALTAMAMATGIPTMATIRTGLRGGSR